MADKQLRVLRWLKVIVIIYAVVLFLVVIAEPYLMFPGILRPTATIDNSAPELSIVSIETGDDQKIQGLQYVPDAPRGIVIYCHGNGDLICYQSGEIKSIAERFNVAVLTFDYRGYGDSDGFPSASRLYVDGQSVYDYCIAQGYAPEQIIIHGSSLGGAVGVHIAENNPTAGMVIISSFDSVVDVAAGKFRVLPVRWLLRNHFPSSEKIANYTGPLLQRHGDRDGVVPLKHGKLLYNAAVKTSEKAFHLARGRGHDYPQEPFWIKYGKFLDRHLPAQRDLPAGPAK